MTEQEAYAHCMKVAREHYENFPVASFLIPRRQRRHVAALYAFARTADDFADEGDDAPGERLRKLDEWEHALDSAFEGRAEDPVFIALQVTARETGIPFELCAALLAAFRQDVTTHRYASYDALLGYCQNSANPVGRLILILFGEGDEAALSCSDALCTGLQLTNFWQDLSVDLRRGRVYLPLEDCARFGYTEDDLNRGVADDRFRALLRFQVERTRRLFDAGAPLIGLTRGRLRAELAATLQGGRSILDAIARVGYDTLHHRPVLGLPDRFSVLWHGLTGSRG